MNDIETTAESITAAIEFRHKVVQRTDLFALAITGHNSTYGWLDGQGSATRDVGWDQDLSKAFPFPWIHSREFTSSGDGLIPKYAATFLFRESFGREEAPVLRLIVRSDKSFALKDLFSLDRSKLSPPEEHWFLHSWLFSPDSYRVLMKVPATSPSTEYALAFALAQTACEHMYTDTRLSLMCAHEDKRVQTLGQFLMPFDPEVYNYAFVKELLQSHDDMWDTTKKDFWE